MHLAHGPLRLVKTYVRADGGGLGLLFVSMSDCSVQLWKRTTDSDGIASWVLARTIELDKLLPLDSQNRSSLLLREFAEENNVLFLSTFLGVFMVQLDSLQFKKLFETDGLSCHHPFESVYIPGNSTPSHYGSSKTKLFSDNWLMECHSHPFALSQQF